ncbi:MAG: hypothetical protein NTY46_16690, partial [Candidatus Sumerlaeota bacterium]|nr:hypothetical protein [Candidatus Sumerlaeota bacterium]
CGGRKPPTWPYDDKKTVRVAGPFTVKSLSIFGKPDITLLPAMGRRRNCRKMAALRTVLYNGDFD